MYMIVASAALPPAANRVTNLVVASLLVPFTIYNISRGEYLLFYGLGIVLKLVLLALVLQWLRVSPRRPPAERGRRRRGSGRRTRSRRSGVNGCASGRPARGRTRSPGRP